MACRRDLPCRHHSAWVHSTKTGPTRGEVWSDPDLRKGLRGQSQPSRLSWAPDPRNLSGSRFYCRHNLWSPWDAHQVRPSASHALQGLGEGRQVTQEPSKTTDGRNRTRERDGQKYNNIPEGTMSLGQSQGAEGVGGRKWGTANGSPRVNFRATG